jgi:hypothetical protein
MADHITTDAAMGLVSLRGCTTTLECALKWLNEAYDAIESLVQERDRLLREQAGASEVLADAAAQDAELKQLRARYDWLCAHLTQIHVETTQPADSPADSPMRVTLIQAWPTLPRTDAESVDAAVVVAMKEGL